MSEAKFEELRSRLAEVNDLGRTMALLGWDQQVMMPRAAPRAGPRSWPRSAGSPTRSSPRPEIGRLLDELRDFGRGARDDSFEASLVRVAARDWEKASRVPAELRAEMARSAALANPVWVEARGRTTSRVVPARPAKNLDLRKRYIDCFDVDDEPYDIVLDDFERGMKTAEVRRALRLPEGAPGAARQGGRRRGAEASRRAHEFPLDEQKQFELEVVREFGFDDDGVAARPDGASVRSGAGTQDIRITTRYFEDNLDGLFGTMHEFGHGLYEHQIDPTLERSPLARGASLGMHESQSRMWENLVGRSLPFWRYFFPRLQELFPDALAATTPSAGTARSTPSSRR